jgi:uncharacterized protein YprB with RNaseH-like and TPR domain
VYGLTYFRAELANGFKMPSLSDKLKSLGVKIGPQDITPPRSRKPESLDEVLGGSLEQTPHGEIYLIKSVYPPGYQYGQTSLFATPALPLLAAWSGDERIKNYSLESFAFLDTETTGLFGGTGTYTFLIGVGRFEADHFHLTQFFMRDPADEPAILIALEELLGNCQSLVTYNGKAFDIPLLRTRYITQGWRNPLADFAHLDLLHLARRLWKDRLPSRTLGNLEVQILGISRTAEDIPGWMIPEIYFEYLRSGDPQPLKNVIYHNAMDVLSLASLFVHSSWILAEPLEGRVQDGIDLIAMAKLFENLGELDKAIELYQRGLESNTPEDTQINALSRMASIHKRRGDFQLAVICWQNAASHHDLSACIELAKYYEHQVQDYNQALQWTTSALSIIQESHHNPYERVTWERDLSHRIERISKKSQAASRRSKHGEHD